MKFRVPHPFAGFAKGASFAGASYYRARYYDPSAGRFISADPTGFNGDGANFYAYVRNSPVDWIDPAGLFAELVCEPVPTLRGGWKDAFFLLISRARHCYIHVKCRDYNVTIELTGPTPQDPGHGVPTMSPFNPNRGGMHIPINVPAGYECCQFEDNLLINFLEAGSNLPTYSGYPGPNSNGFAYQVITGAGGSVEMPPTAYGWDYLPPVPTSPAPQH